MGKRRVLVIGGGISAMTAAITLARQGAAVTVVERNPEWTITGWGLALSGPALRALDALGVAEPCIWAGYGINEVAECDAAGVVQRRFEPPRMLGPQKPALVGLGRGTLHQILRSEAERAGARLLNGLVATRIAQTADSAGVQFSDGSLLRADVVIGADGARSATRDLIGISERPADTGQTVWWGLLPRPEWATAVHLFSGGELKAGLLPISPRQAALSLTEPDADRTAIPGDQLAGRMRELMAGFEGRPAQARDALLDESVVRRPVRAGLVAGAWYRGRVVLVGDAAHEIAPQARGGAALAVEDALVLAEELAAHGDVEQAFEAYGARRIDRCRLAAQASVEVAAAESAGRPDEARRLREQCDEVLAQPI
jgi:2-polyprenyl-6-methoxyphenol hydroxylase-like FAD-dependent oxidoreductase